MEDVTRMITLSKLKDDELTDDIQCISFVTNVNDHNITLMELDNTLLSYLTEGKR